MPATGWRRLGSWAAIAAVVAVLVPLGAQPAGGESHEQITITTDTTLTADHYGEIVFGADGITLDCAGYSVLGRGLFGVQITSRSGVSVVDCVIDRHHVAISVVDSSAVRIDRVTVFGIAGVGIALRESNQVTITASSVTGYRTALWPCPGDVRCGLGIGVSASFSTDVDIRDTSASGNGNGFSVGTSTGVTIIDSEAHDNRATGFVDASPTPNRYENNTCFDNIRAGSSPPGLCDWGVTDQVGFFDPTTGEWHVPAEDGTTDTFVFGDPGDVPLVGAWGHLACYAHPRVGVYRPSEGKAYLDGLGAYRLGDPGDIPLAGDFDGFGCDSVSLYRPSTQQFLIFNSTWPVGEPYTEPDAAFVFGNPGDVPVVGDWDNDGIDEVGLHRPSTGVFYWRNTLDTGIADGMIYYGNPGDRFVAGDWGLGDGFDTPGVFRPADSTVYLRHTLTEGPADAAYPDGKPWWLPVTVRAGIAAESGFG